MSNRERVGKGFELLAEGLAPFVEHHIAGVVPGGMEWLPWLGKRLYPQNPRMKVSRNDPLILLRAITKEKDAFKDVISRTQGTYAQELWEFRNNWAHNGVFNKADTNRLLDTMERLLRSIGADVEADEVRKLLNEHQRETEEIHQPLLSAPEHKESRPKPAWQHGGFAITANGRDIGITAGIWITLSALALAILPSVTLSEEILVVCACLTLAIAAVTGSRARDSHGHFTIMAVSVGSAVILLASLSIAVNSQGRRSKADASAGISANTPPAQHPRQQHPSRSSANAVSTTPRISPSASPGRKRSLYLSTLTGTTAGYGSDSPEYGAWDIANTRYPKSLGYPSLCGLEYFSFQFQGTYKYLIATVGVADGANPMDRGTSVDFEVHDNSGNILGSATAQYGRPTPIRVPIEGISSLTLFTTIGPSENCLSNGSVAVWGNLQLIPPP